MELKKNFIKNDIGIIPEDWSLSNIGDVCQIFGRIGFRGYTVKDIVAEKEGAITISPSNIQDGKMDFLKCTYISWFKYEESPEIKIFNGDILLVKTGSTFGKTAIISDLYEKATINPQLVVLKNIKVDNAFLAFMMSYKVVQNQIKSTIVGGAIPTLSQQLVANYKIPLPPTLNEQTAIATALSDADALISSLEKLIEKKRAIKQGAMQELLNGEKRLHGFKGKWLEWDIATICSSFTKQTGFDYSAYIKPSLVTKYEKGTIPFIQNKDFNGFFINFDTDYFVPEIIADAFPRILLNEKCLLISISGSIGRVAIFSNTQKAFIGGAIAVGKFKDKSLLEWVMFNLQSQKGQDKLFINVKQGSHQNLILDDIRKITIPIPPKEERDKIVSILTDVENEILSLEKNLSKHKMLKHGMMQELLTGKTRLI